VTSVKTQIPNRSAKRTDSHRDTTIIWCGVAIRLNYVLWIQDIIRATPGNPCCHVQGIDMYLCRFSDSSTCANE